MCYQIVTSTKPGHPAFPVRTQMTPTEVGFSLLLDRYDTFLFDSFGVLVDGVAPLPGAISLLRELDTAGKRWLVLTNDASRLPGSRLSRLRSQGFEVSESQLVTSGSLLAHHFEESGLVGKGIAVLGTPDSLEYVRRAGGNVIGLSQIHERDAAAFVLGAVTDDPWPELLEALISWLFRRFDSDRPIDLILTNPDLIYPSGADKYRIGPGGVALLIEQALQRKFRRSPPLVFTGLGKPNRPIFDEAVRRAGDPGRMVMVGDQLETDVAGANRAGIDSVLMGTGIARWSGPGDFDGLAAELVPRWLVRGLG